MIVSGAPESSKMRFSISHTVRYAYDRPVFVEPHILRLRPLQEPAQRLREFRCRIIPTPQHVGHSLDQDDNHAIFACFQGTTEQLSVEARAEVTTSLTNPFDYVLHPGADSLDQLYDDDLRFALAPYLRHQSELSDDCGMGHDGDESDYAGLSDLASELAERANRSTLPFLDHLNAELNRRFNFIVREHGEPLAPAETLRRSEVACRDVTTLFIDVCRAVGIASRFVSGYTAPDPDALEHDMHAWAEVYLPGAGWRGYDPTTGLAVADHHVAVARSADSANASPVSGSIRGSDATSKMSTQVHIEVTRA